VKKLTADLSGFGGGYEAMCQTMLWRGVLHLAEVRPSLEMWKGAKSYTNIYGLLFTEGVELKALEKSMLHPGDDATGAMHQCVMGHLRQIHEHGVDGWVALIRKRAPARLYETEVTL